MSGSLTLLGAGLSSGQLTPETGSALAASAARLSLHVPRQLLPAGVEALHDDDSLLSRVRLELAAGRSVAVLLPGHPALHGPGQRLARLARRLRAPCRVVPAPGAFDAVLAALAPLSPDAELCSAPWTTASAEDLASGRLKPDPGQSLALLSWERLDALGRAKAAKALAGRRVWVVSGGEARPAPELASLILDGQATVAAERKR